MGHVTTYYTTTALGRRSAPRACRVSFVVASSRVARVRDDGVHACVVLLSAPVSVSSRVGATVECISTREDALLTPTTNFRLSFVFFAQADVEAEFTCEGPITVFAPNDDAFGDFAKAQGLSKVDLMNYGGLKDVVLNHVAKGKFTAAEGLPAEVTMISGKKVSTAGMKFKKNDIKVDNATIHAITTVIA